MGNFLRYGSVNLARVYVVNVDDRTPSTEISFNKEMKTIRFEVIRPEGSKINANFRRFCIIVKDASFANSESKLDVEEIEKILLGEANAELKYICVHKQYGTAMGFLHENKKFYELVIPDALPMDCLIAVYCNDNEDEKDKISCYVDATNRKINEPDIDDDLRRIS